MRRTAEESEKTRENILDISLKLFGQKGYNATKLSDIAKEAGITRGAIYHHFENKGELFRALLNRYQEKTIETITPYMETPEKSIDKLKKGFQAYFKLLESDVGMLEFQKVQILKQELKPSSLEMQICRKDVKTHFKIIEQVVLDGQNKDEFRKDVDASQFSYFLFAYTFGIINIWIFFDEPYSLSETGAKYINKFLENHLY